MQRVFVATSHLGRQGVLIARTGRESVDPVTGERFLILENGVRYGGAAGDADYRVIRFARYGIRVEVPAATQRYTSLHGMSDPSVVARIVARRGRRVALAGWPSRWRCGLGTVRTGIFLQPPASGPLFWGCSSRSLPYFLYSNLLGVGECHAQARARPGRARPVVGTRTVHRPRPRPVLATAA